MLDRIFPAATFTGANEGAIEFAPGYFVTKDGRIFSTKYRKPREIKLQPHPRGYLQFGYQVGRKKKGLFVHRIVARAFLGPRPHGLMICHGDGNKLNNHIDNLRYGTAKENAEDAVKHGHTPRGSRNHKAILTEQNVIHARLMSDCGLLVTEIAESTGWPITALRNAVSGSTWRHLL